MTILFAILKASAFVAVFFGAAILHMEIDNRRCRRCDACRLDRQNGRLFVPLAHTCSRRRALWRSRDGDVRSEFGRVTLNRPKPSTVTVGKRRIIPTFTRQARNVVQWKART